MPDRTGASLTVLVRHDTLPLASALVRAGTDSRRTDERGVAILRLAGGAQTIVALKIGFRPETLVVMLRPGTDTTVTMTMEEQAVALAGVTVSATRSGKRIEDEPLRVEVLEQEEVEEKLLMTPGDITMMLNESSGLRVQTTSPSTGGAVVRVQGLRGRYTQILADGLPLHGGQTGGLGLLQIPPMDLGGVEIIKGVASALYGGSALGGVINLLSRRPGSKRSAELLLNGTTRGGTDVVAFASEQLSGRWGYTLLAGAHRQRRVDADADGWSDSPGYDRVVIRPRLFWSSETGNAIMLTTGTTLERRAGGTEGGATVPDGESFPEELRTGRHDLGVVGGFALGEVAMLTVRGAGSLQRHRHAFGFTRERDRHGTLLGEMSVTGARGISLWVAGVALQREHYRADDVGGFDYDYTTPALFAQNTLTLGPALSVTASARLDRHSAFGTQFAPRLSALVRLAPEWTLRASAGGGYFAPTPFTEETEVIGLTPLDRLRDLREERARSGSLDLGGAIGPLELNLTAFGSVIDHPVGVRSAADVTRVTLVNLDQPTRTAGSELLLRWEPEPFHVTGSYTFVRSTEQDPETGARRATPLTPRHQAGVVTMWEQEGRARAGLEVYYTGVQSLDDDPYRDESEPYVHVGVLAERRFGVARVFINAENLLGSRQTNHDPLVRPSRGRGGRWTTDVWGPLEGRVANAGVRLELR